MRNSESIRQLADRIQIIVHTIVKSKQLETLQNETHEERKKVLTNASESEYNTDLIGLTAGVEVKAKAMTIAIKEQWKAELANEFSKYFMENNKAQFKEPLIQAGALSTLTLEQLMEKAIIVEDSKSQKAIVAAITEPDHQHPQLAPNTTTVSRPNLEAPNQVLAIRRSRPFQPMWRQRQSSCRGNFNYPRTIFTAQLTPRFGPRQSFNQGRGFQNRGFQNFNRQQRPTTANFACYVCRGNHS